MMFGTPENAPGVIHYSQLSDYSAGISLSEMRDTVCLILSWGTTKDPHLDNISHTATQGIPKCSAVMAPSNDFRFKLLA